MAKCSRRRSWIMLYRGQATFLNFFAFMAPDTFGDFLRAILTADQDFHPEDSDGVRDAFMQAFRLRGIVAEEAASFSEELLFWPKVERNKLAISGLLFGDPNGLTKAERDINGTVLRAFAKANARLLGFDPTKTTSL
jgi:hypothetical protein